MNCNYDNAITIVRGNDTDWNGARFLTINLITEILDLSTFKAIFTLGNIKKQIPDISSGVININLTATETKTLPPKLYGTLTLEDTNKKIATIESLIPFKVIDCVHGQAIATEPHTLNFNVEQGGETILTVNVESAVSVEVGQTTTLPAGSNATVVNSGTDNHLVLDFGIPEGNGINNISKTSTSGLVDTYTVTYDKGNTDTFNITNGNGINNIAKTSTSGLIDTYTITFDNNNTETFTVTNGKDGTDGTSAIITGATASITNTTGVPSVTVTSGGTSVERSFNFAFSNLKGEKGNTGATGADGYSPTATVVTENGVTTFTITDKNGTTTSSFEIINTVLSTSTSKALSANMGKELQAQITHLQGIGRFLALWDCSTGLAETNPPVSPYQYKTGDYFIVGIVDTTTNYKPNGSSYTTGTASTTVETETIDVGNVYYYDGTTWKLQAGGGGGTITDVQVNGTSVVSSGVANIPKASANDLGIAKINTVYGIGITANGELRTSAATDAEIESKSNTAKPLVPSSINKTIMEGLGNNSLTWTDTYKSNARNTIGAIGDVKVNSTSVVTNGVANIPIAGNNNSTLGVVQTNFMTYGIGVNSTGFIYISPASTSQISDKTNSYRPLVPSTLDYAVKIGVTTNTNTLTATEKTNACNWLGAAKGTVVESLDDTDSITLADNTIYFCGVQVSLTIALPSTNTMGFLCEIDFSSGTTATTLTYPNTIKWIGDDIASNIFTPVVSKRYTVIIYYDGIEYVGVVKGVE